MALRAEDSYGRFRRALAMARTGDAARAIEDLGEAIRLEPRMVSAYVERGRLLARGGQAERAISDFGEAIALAPKYHAAWRIRGMAQYRAGRHDLALADLNEALRLDAKDSVARNELAWLLATSPKDAVRDGRLAVDLARAAAEQSGWKNPGLLDTYAAALAEAGQFAEAVKWQQQALELPGLAGEAKAGAEQRLRLYREGKPYRTP